MYLKSIEVQGFKSFANKIVFKFTNGITGIVGPNGSGKSNVADAVRWVLGEQRIKQLRGASMQDVIFSGTQMRKPVGSAYVAITLDNSDHSLAIDYDEVTVARRIYRSGESEYLINGTVCRLKDVNELFYDTGIGKEGYSIIGQGQIDKILSSKPEDRRELFDEAAGIVKYKRRKVEACRKLEAEQQNLVRVSDILSELEKQIGPLEKQSEKAKIYLKHKEELKTLDVNVFLLESKRVREQLEELDKKAIIAENDFNIANEANEKLKAEYDEIEGILAELEKEIEESRSSLANTDVMREKLEGEIKLLKEQIHSAEGNKEHMNARLSSVDEQLAAKEAEKAVILESKNEIDLKTAEGVALRDAAREELLACQTNIETLNFSVEKSKNCIIELLNERATIKAKISRLDSMTEQNNIRLSELNARILKAKTEEAEQDDVIAKLEGAFQAVTKEIEERNHEIRVMEERAGKIHDDLGEMDKKLRDTQVLYHQEKSKLEAITNLTERYEGYGSSVKKVMEQKASNPGICGVVADIIKVDAKYETAIETALGGNIQNIVTDNEATAKKMIQFLKDNKHGRATFLPLTSITNPQEFKNPEALNEPGVIGMADALVHLEAKYKDVAKAMLGRIVVVDTVDNALKIAKKFDYGIRMVTLEGELLVPGGAISGGAFRNNSNLLGRRREMDELEKKVKTLLKEIDGILDDIENLKKERNELRKNMADAKDNLQGAFIRQNTARLNVMQAQEKKGDVQKGFDELKLEEEDLRESLQHIAEEKNAIQKEFADSQALEQKETEAISVNQKKLEEARAEETEKLNKVAELDLEVEKLLQRQGFEQQNLNRVDGEIARHEDEKKEIVEGINSGTSDIQFKTESIEEIEKTIAASHTAKSDTQIKLDAAITKRDELNAKQKSFFEERDKLSKQINDLDKEIFRLKSQKERAEESMASQSSYMWQEYEITLHDAQGLRNEEMNDLPAMKKEVSSLKDKIKRLGDVNVNAIEDYKNVMERYTFLHKQHEDLIEAEKSLQKIIVDLDELMRKQFRERFAEIDHEFDKVFKELFGGGQANLELMDDDDILEAGIKIIAQPPGKKLQNMMQLSGGEKALTAISLLFAIQNLKPSPFCLLDEIEAALDESNVDRFAKYLHKMTKSTQFIVITHRRGTMDQANQLYGITMQEKGVSTLVSVDLQKNEA